MWSDVDQLVWIYRHVRTRTPHHERQAPASLVALMCIINVAGYSVDDIETAEVLFEDEVAWMVGAVVAHFREGDNVVCFGTFVCDAAHWAHVWPGAEHEHEF